jgi:hypothetical protein
MRHQLRSHGALAGERSKPARLAVHATTDALLAGKVQRKVSNGIAGLPAAGSSRHRQKIAQREPAGAATIGWSVCRGTDDSCWTVCSGIDGSCWTVCAGIAGSRGGALCAINCFGAPLVGARGFLGFRPLLFGMELELPHFFAGSTLFTFKILLYPR